ncbi:MAG: CRISPR-associated endonuclease Cas2 [Vampirovibrionales bacterium]|nr:CRISPR-associated endonuclease Cas2 [Vampirovibrionales bacterium]
MFDLPVIEPEERLQASRFRNGLLDLGFFMLQESVYARNCVSQEKYQQHLGDVKTIAPNRGLINGFFITNKQWLTSVSLTLTKPKKTKRGIEAGEKTTQQMTFW